MINDIKELITRLSYLLFPRRCALCGQVVAFDEERCEECGALHCIEEYCKKCGREKNNCVCEKEKYHSEYADIASPYYFEGSVYTAIYRLKSGKYPELAKGMAKDMAGCVRARFGEEQIDYICCVPMTDKKRKKRGYNQSELLARALSDELGVEYRMLLKKCFETKSQRLSSAKERRNNLYGAFEKAQDIDLKGKTVLIADDVKTTGSTLNECAVTLKSYGVKRVFVSTLAVTNKKK